MLPRQCLRYVLADGRPRRRLDHHDVAAQRAVRENRNMLKFSSVEFEEN